MLKTLLITALQTGRILIVRKIPVKVSHYVSKPEFLFNCSFQWFGYNTDGFVIHDINKASLIIYIEDCIHYEIRKMIVAINVPVVLYSVIKNHLYMQNAVVSFYYSSKSDLILKSIQAYILEYLESLLKGLPKKQHLFNQYKSLAFNWRHEWLITPKPPQFNRVKHLLKKRKPRKYKP